jgi:hypothetical protein
VHRRRGDFARDAAAVVVAQGLAADPDMAFTAVFLVMSGIAVAALAAEVA